MKHVLAAACLSLAVALPTAVSAQTFSPLGFSSLPSFAWPGVDPATGRTRWEGSYASMSTGFEVASSKHFGTIAGPTVGFEGGRMWREGDFVYGIVGGFDYLSVLGGPRTPGFGQIAYSRDFAGGVALKAGVLVTDNLLVYSKLGATAINETWRVGASPVSVPFSRDDIAVRPEARVGAEWAVTDHLTLGLEMGITGSNLR